MSEVFVSYKRENLAAVGRLVEALRAEGIGVWWDQDIPPNAAWEATIEQALAAAKLVIVAWSPAAVASENVKAEARWARAQGRLLQVFVEACEPPLFFGERQGVDLKHWSGAPTDATFRLVLTAIRSGLATSSLPPSDLAATADETPVPAAPPLPTKPSIAILPFANLSSDPEQDYFADGMVEEIAAALSRFKSIFVIGSGSSLSFKGKTTTAQEAAEVLGVRYVLEGSVRKAGGRVRIAVKLIDAADGAQIWADRFEDTLEDVFALQDKVAISVAGVIEPALREADMRRASVRPTESMNSYDLFLRGISRYRLMSRTDAFAALDLFDRAIALDPDYALALAYALNCHGFVVAFGWSDDPASHQRQAQRIAQKLAAVGGDDPDVLALLANAMTVTGGDIETAATIADHAAELNPGSPLVWLARGWVRIQLGEPQIASEYLETSLRLDPLTLDRHFVFAGIAVVRMAQRQFAEAIPLLKQAMQLRPEWPLPVAALAVSYGHLGQLGDAREAVARFRSLSSYELEAWAMNWRLDLQKLFLDGIALAKGEGSPHLGETDRAP